MKPHPIITRDLPLPASSTSSDPSLTAPTSNLKSFLSPHMKSSPMSQFHSENGTSYLKFKHQRTVPDRVTSAEARALFPHETDSSLTVTLAPESANSAIYGGDTPPSHDIQYKTRPLSNSIHRNGAPVSQENTKLTGKTSRQSSKGFLPSLFGRVTSAARKRSLGKSNVTSQLAAPKPTNRSTRSASTSSTQHATKRRINNVPPISTKRNKIWKGSNGGTVALATTSSDNTTIITCKLCGKRIYGSDNYVAHQRQHDTTSEKYFQERKFIMENTASMRSFLDSRSHDTMTAAQLRKKGLLSSSTTQLDEIFQEELKQQSKLTLNNAMAQLENREWREAFEAFQKLARKNNTAAMMQLAKMYECGVHVKEDEKEAARWYKKAADNNHSGLNMPHIAIVCRFLGVEEENQKAETPKTLSEECHTQHKQRREAYFAFKELALEKPSPDIHYWLGRCYECGAASCGVNLKKAETYYKKAAGMGHARAMCRIAVLHLSAAVSAPEDEDKLCAEAVKQYKNAIVHSYPRALYFLSIMYARGKGVEQNTEESNRLLSQAKDAGVYLGDHHKSPQSRQGREEHEDGALSARSF